MRILSTFKRALRSSILVVCLTIFMSLSGVSVFVQQASYATTLEELKLIPPEYKPNSQEKINRANEYDPGIGIQEEDRQAAYEQAIKDSQNLNTLEKAYDRNLRNEKAQNSSQGFGEKAKQVIEKVAGK